MNNLGCAKLSTIQSLHNGVYWIFTSYFSKARCKLHTCSGIYPGDLILLDPPLPAQGRLPRPQHRDLGDRQLRPPVLCREPGISSQVPSLPNYVSAVLMDCSHWNQNYVEGKILGFYTHQLIIKYDNYLKISGILGPGEDNHSFDMSYLCHHDHRGHHHLGYEQNCAEPYLKARLGVWTLYTIT